MADMTDAKSGPGGQFPANATEVQWNRVEPLITPTQLKNRYLFGIPLVSAIKDPITSKHQVMTDDLLKDNIDLAVSEVELAVSMDIFPNYNKEKQAFDRNEYLSFGYFRTERRPCTKINQISVCPTTNEDIFIVPIEWVETAYLHRGQIALIPMTAALGVSGNIVPATSSGGAVFLQIIGDKQWLSAFWKIEYISGYPDGMLPKPVNEAIGVCAAIRVLSLLAATNAKATSHSLGIDGLSQSVSGPGAQLYMQRIQELEAQKKVLVKKLKTMIGQTIFTGNV